MGLGPLKQLTVEERVDLLVVEGDHAGDGQELAGGKVVRPGQVLVPRAADPDRPVTAGHPLVGARGHRVGGAAFDRLDSLQQFFPYSDQSINALQKECYKILAEAGNEPALSILMPPFKVRPATLIKDLQRLGIHPGRRIQRSG